MKGLALAALLAAPALAQEGTYANPLPVTSLLGPVESCADPSVIDGGTEWAMACTTDPLTAEDRDEAGDLVFRLVPLFRSDDLVEWAYAGDAFDRDPATPTPDPPAWADPTAVLWAPEIERVGDLYVLLFAVTDVVDEAGGEPGCDEDSAIGHATSASPFGPWEPAPEPLVRPRRTDAGCEFFWTLDPEVHVTDAGAFVYYGSYHGGIEVRDLVVGADGGLSAPEGTAAPVTIPSRYEGAEVVEHEGFHYLFASATNCCAGPQTGYAVFAARSESPRGPFLDRDGASVLEAGVGGTPVLAQNGNAWIGVGHNTVLQDREGQWWTLYHAVEEADPYYAGEPGFTRRPVLMDPLDWGEGWPVINGGAGPSDGPQAAPGTGGPRPVALASFDEPGAPIPEASDDFADLDAFAWVRRPEGVAADGTLRWETEDADLYEDRDDAGVLTRPAPDGDYVVEVRVRLDVPPEGCCQNYVQAGLVIRADDDAYVKLVVASIWETRQTEWAREVPDPPEGAPRYGNTVVGPPGEDWTWLRVAVRREGSTELYRAYTSRDGETWRRGGAWRHALGGGRDRPRLHGRGGLHGRVRRPAREPPALRAQATRPPARHTPPTVPSARRCVMSARRPGRRRPQRTVAPDGAGGHGGRHGQRPLQGDAQGDERRNGSGQGQIRARERAVLQGQASPVPQDAPSAQAHLVGARPRKRHAVRDEKEAVGPGSHRRAQGRGRDVDAVGDEARVDVAA
jgi:arabinan endo-1,5-alpha-L-arabinosidase